ncbi:hypothetical protein BDR22DRAFT_852199 [Usnea florida]
MRHHRTPRPSRSTSGEAPAWRSLQPPTAATVIVRTISCLISQLIGVPSCHSVRL